MLCIEVPIGPENWDEETEQFVTETRTLRLEHSLVSLSKWESKWCKPFLSQAGMTPEETLDYIRFMTLNDVDPDIYDGLTKENVREIVRYIEAPMTATTFSKDKGKRNREIITAELIYYWMISMNIPFECREWHLNQLLTLIRVCSIKNQPAKKMSRREIMRRNAALNAERKAKLNSKG